MEVIGGILMIGMLIGIGTNEIDTQIKLSDMKKNVSDAKDKLNSIKDRWKALMKQQIVTDEDINKEILTKYDEINQLVGATNVSRKNFTEAKKRIEYTGIIIVISVFFMLLAKHYDIYNIFLK